MAKHFPRTWLLGLSLAVAGAFGFAACSSSPSHSSGAAKVSYNTGSGPEFTSTTAAGAAIQPIPPSDLSATGTYGTAPTVTVPAGAPPTSLESADLIVGKGPVAQPGDTVQVQYVLASYSTRKVVQSSWTSQPFTFDLGAGKVIPGWDEGVVGMKVGGRRELIIPPSLAYKNESNGPGIAPDDTLVFVIDLINVN